MSNKLPPALIQKLINDYQIETESFISNHEAGQQITSIRINPNKKDDLFPDMNPIPWCPYGYYLPERPSFITDPLFHAGCYYVQEASSMFLSHIINALALDKKPVLALDLCAAPGGKSTLLQNALHPKSLLLANEIIETRALTLSDNLTRWGQVNGIATNNDPVAFQNLPGYFDILLVDAPCSGSGMFRQDSQRIQEWSEAAVTLCSQRQKRILADSLVALKEGGILIYSTCSYSKEENEDVLDWMVSNFGLQSLQIPIPKTWGIEETLSDKNACFGYRFYLHKVQGEGFFAAALIKTTPQPAQTPNASKQEKIKQPLIDPTFLRQNDLSLLPFEDEYFIFPLANEGQLKHIQNVLYIKKAGTKVGKWVNKRLIPHPELALSTLRLPETFTIEFDTENALNFLKRKAFTVDTLYTGWALATYRGHGLGWIKILPNRVNNYYPKAWRILKEG